MYNAAVNTEQPLGRVNWEIVKETANKNRM